MIKKTLTVLLAVLLLMSLAPSAFAQLPAGDYTVTINGEQIEGTMRLVDASLFSVGDAWCYIAGGNIVGCGAHAWNTSQDYFIYAGQLLFQTDGDGAGGLGDAAIQLVPLCDGFSPQQAACQIAE